MLIFFKFPICFLVLHIFVTCVYDWAAFNDASVLTGEVAKRDFSSVHVLLEDGGLKQTEETRRQLEEKRRLVSCDAFVKGNAFNMVNVASCVLSITTTISDGETLRIRGKAGLDHPELNRNGAPVSHTSHTEISAHHFVMTGTSALTLMNLKLSGAWNGAICNCGYCQGCRSECINYCEFGNFHNFQQNIKSDKFKGGALRIQSGTSTTRLTDVIFETNKGYAGTGNIFSTETSAKLYLLNMLAIPSEIVGITPELECNDGFMLKSDNTGCIVEGSDP